MQYRNKSLDLLKLIAILTMVIDHLRFIFPTIQMELISVGRWAFVIFAILIAINTFNAVKNNKNDTLKNYAKNLIIFTIISEMPYRLMVGETQIFNVMLTLLLGFTTIIIYAKIKQIIIKYMFLFAFLFSILLFQSYIQYGFLGVLLIFVAYLFFCSNCEQSKIIFFVLSLVIAIACNLQYYLPIIEVLGFWNNFTFPIVISVISAMLFSLLILKKELSFNVPRIGKWAYWFYPVHMILIFLIVRFI